MSNTRASAFALFFLAEYANMILVSFLTALMFLGGWLSPIPAASPGCRCWAAPAWTGGWLLKALFFAFCFLWFRATFPRYRYDQIMRLGWKVFIPITIVWIAGRRGDGGVARALVDRRREDESHDAPGHQLLQEPAAAGTAAGHGADPAYLFKPKYTVHYPEEKIAAVAALPRPACAAPLSERRRALHRLQAVRGGVPGAGDHHRLGAARRRHAAAPRATTSICSSASTAASARNPARWIRSSRPTCTNTTSKARREHRDQAQLLAIGDRLEAEIAERKRARRGVPLSQDSHEP
jgi:hypothetical protein